MLPDEALVTIPPVLLELEFTTSGSGEPSSSQHSKNSGSALTERTGFVAIPLRDSPWYGFRLVGGWRLGSEGIHGWGCCIIISFVSWGFGTFARESITLWQLHLRVIVILLTPMGASASSLNSRASVNVHPAGSLSAPCAA